MMNAAAAPSATAPSIDEVFARCRQEDRAALIGYLPVGFPTVRDSIRAMEVMVSAGVDIVEVGLPYTDPLMDGPVIQRAVESALRGGSRVDDGFLATAAVRAAGAPAMVMTAWNLVARRGVDRYAAQLAEAGGSGLITPDLTPDEAGEWIDASERIGLSRMFLVSPNSPRSRLEYVTAACRGFVYAASTLGVTGERAEVGSRAQELVERVRVVSDLPVCVGLGVSNAAQASEIARYADGVIVGTAFVKVLAGPGELDERLESLRQLTADLADGVRDSSSATHPPKEI